MHVDYAFICDYAEAKDKVNALGIGFDRIYAKNAPVRHPHFSVVIQLRFTRTEIGPKPVQIHLTDADGTDITPPVNGQIVVNTPPPGFLEVTARLVMEFANVEFKNYGDYAIRVDVAAQEMVSIPISIVQLPERPAN
jgi:hypothetical protein